MELIPNIVNSIHTVSYIYRLAVRENLRNPFKEWREKRENPICVLANGPSLKELLTELDAGIEKYGSADFFVLNDFVNDSHFTTLHPKYYVLSDPLFFMDTLYAERGHKVMNALRKKVQWPMALFIPWRYKESKYLDVVRQNPNIRIVAFHSVRYYGVESLRNFFYKKGLGNGEFGTVALNAIYIALMIGYKRLHVYGIDHTFFNNIAVNSDNELCFKEEHFYEKETNLRPMICHYPGNTMEGKSFTVYEFLKEKASIFKGHQIMNDFAKEIGATIVNCSRNSLVDAYERKE